MWLYYWLASAGINPFDDVRTVVVPPPQMVMNMRIGNMVGFASASRGMPGPLTIASVLPLQRRSLSGLTTRKILGTRRDWVEKIRTPRGRW